VSDILISSQVGHLPAVNGAIRTYDSGASGFQFIIATTFEEFSIPLTPQQVITNVQIIFNASTAGGANFGAIQGGAATIYLQETPIGSFRFPTNNNWGGNIIYQNIPCNIAIFPNATLRMEVSTTGGANPYNVEYRVLAFGIDT